MTKKEITELRKEIESTFGGIQYAVNGTLLISEYKCNKFLDLLHKLIEKEGSR